MKRSSHAWRLRAERLADCGVPVEDMADKERFNPRLEGVLLLVEDARAACAAFFLSHRVIFEETAVGNEGGKVVTIYCC